MAKKKDKKHGLSTGAIVAIAIGIVLVFGIVFDSLYPDEEDAKDSVYNKADDKWQQYNNILTEDEAGLQDIVDDYCTGELYKADIDECVNLISPALSAYSTHISNAQIFMKSEGQVFGNDVELSGYLDKKMIYAESLANNVNTLVNNYNSQQTSSGSMIDEETLGTILKILAMAV
jgi:uncharacterized protein YpmS